MATTRTNLVPLLCLIFASAYGITSTDKSTRDSYLSAYMDSKGTNDVTVGVVYPEPHRTYGPPQPKPVYYGPPVPPSGPLMEYPSSYSPIMDMMSYLPQKLEFLPKVASVLLTVTKILLKVVLLKIILKFIFMFCLYFFLPKIEMLDMMTSFGMSETSTVMAPSNVTTAASPDDQEEMRLNKITNFVMDSVETKKFLEKFCKSESQFKCKFLTNLMKLDNMVSISKFFSRLKIPNRDSIPNEEFTKDNSR